MGYKENFNNRLRELRLNVDVLKEVRVHLSTGQLVIPNQDGKRGSLQVYAAITSPDGYITPEEARRGLAVYGDEYIAESRACLGVHPGIEGLQSIVESGTKVRSDVYRKESVKMHPFNEASLKEAAEEFGTPMLFYDEATIRKNMASLRSAFSWVPGGFMNHIAVKATDCAPIIKIAVEEGMGVDCASAKELHMARAMGIPGERAMLTSNATPSRLYKQAKSMGAIINFDDVTHLDIFRREVGELPETVYLRYNPGTRMFGGNGIIGHPGEQKYGIMDSQLPLAVRKLKEYGTKRVGLQQMIVSNELNEENLIGAAINLMKVGDELSKMTDLEFAGINFGGGLGHVYRPEQVPVDERKVAMGIKEAYDKILGGGRNAGLQIKMENGRWITAGSGVLLMTALHLEQKPGGEYVKVDASGNDFARVEAYGCYQHLVVLGKQGNQKLYHVAGPKCENSDHWAKNRLLPQVERGDVLALCGAGAHGRMMGSEYNGFPKCGEVMLRLNGKFEMLTRRETLRDQFAKYDFPGSEFRYLAQIEG